jgi:phenylacetate-CoA ligase
MTRLVGLGGSISRYFQLKSSQYASAETLSAYTEQHLSNTLATSATIPFYRERLASARKLTEIAPLPRKSIPELYASVRSRFPDNIRFANSRTSGSTGMPVSFLFDAQHQAGRFAARARYLMTHGWNPIVRSAWIMNIAMESPDAVFSKGSRFLGARFFPHTADLEEQARWLRKLDPLFLYAYPVNLEGLARIFEADGTRLPSLRKIFSGSEVLDDALRARLQRVFGVEVADNYGSTEAFLAWECPAGSYHINAEHVIVEIVDDAGKPAAPGTLGRVLLTTLENHLMPLVRYEIGDYAIAASAPCRCGRSLPRLEKIVGRGVNLFLDRNRKRFVPWDLFRPMKDREWVTQYQIVQRDLGHFIVRYAATRSLDADDEAAVRQHFERILHSPARVEFERLDAVRRAPSGKFMTAMCEISSDG